MKRIRIFLPLLVLLGALFWAGSAAADGIIIIDPPPEWPPERPPVRLDEALTIKYHRVTVTIADQVATTHVDQVFVNENDWVAEGTYIFPLPAGAAINDFVMWVDGEPVRGEILKADEAREIYTDIVSRLRDPALLEYVGRDLVKASVFPIPAGEERRIELEYSEVLTADNGLIHYLYPLSTEKYSARPLEEVSIRVEIESPDAIKAVYSPSHEVFIERDNDYSALVGFEQYDVKPDSDFELYYSVSPEDIGLNLLSYKEAGEDGFFMLLAAPNVEVDPDQVLARDLIFVLDVSGSMEGQKIDQAKDAVLYALEHLNAEDRFNVIAFSTGLQTYDNELQPAERWQDGADFVEGLQAMGGTDINRALLEALDMADAERPTTLIFLTDGLATEGEEETPAILSNVERAAGNNVQLFSFGVGDDVDTDLLDALALDHSGTSSYVRPSQQIDEVVSAFYAKVSTPVLSGLELDWGNARVDQLYPAELPDLFAGSQLVLVGRYREGGPVDIRLSGLVDGERVTFDYPDHTLARNGGADFIPRLWATRAIGHYLTQIRLHGEEAEWVEAVVELSIRYGIITPYTSFLIDEDDIFTQTNRDVIVEEVHAEMAQEAEAPAFGADAVDKAAGEGALRGADSAAALPTMTAIGADGEAVDVAQLIRYVRSKTFVLRDGVWLDTAYDPSQMKPMAVSFLSDDYFALVAALPQLGDYFALGEQVTVVMGDTAYQVVPEDEQGDEVILPLVVADATPEPAETAASNETPAAVVAAADETTTPIPAGGADEPERSTGLCAGAMALPVGLLLVGALAGRPRKKRRRLV